MISTLHWQCKATLLVILTAILDVIPRFLPLLLLPVMAFATEKRQHRHVAAPTGQLYILTECSLSQKFGLWVDQNVPATQNNMLAFGMTQVLISHPDERLSILAAGQ